MCCDYAIRIIFPCYKGVYSIVCMSEFLCRPFMIREHDARIIDLAIFIIIYLLDIVSTVYVDTIIVYILIRTSLLVLSLL